jgi:hypothetical protein
MGLPVLRTLSLCTCCRHYPGAAAGRTLRSASPSRISLPRKGCRVGLRIVLFEDCSAFTRVTACTLALSPIRDTLIEGFSHFVTSMTAPIASDWSGCRVGLAPTGKRRLVTAHTRSRPQDNQPQLVWCWPHQKSGNSKLSGELQNRREDWTMSGNLVEFAAARGFLFIALVLYSAVLE